MKTLLYFSYHLKTVAQLSESCDVKNKLILTLIDTNFHTDIKFPTFVKKTSQNFYKVIETVLYESFKMQISTSSQNY